MSRPGRRRRNAIALLILAMAPTSIALGQAIEPVAVLNDDRPGNSTHLVVDADGRRVVELRQRVDPAQPGVLLPEARLWRTDVKQAPRSIPPPQDHSFWDVGFLADGKPVALALPNDQKPGVRWQMVSLDPGAETRPIGPPLSQENLGTIRLDPDGRFALISGPGRADLIDLTDPDAKPVALEQPLANLSLMASESGSDRVALGQYLLAPSAMRKNFKQACEVRVFERAGGRQLAYVPVPDAFLVGQALADEGRMLAVGVQPDDNASPRRIECFTLPDARPLYQLELDKFATALKASPDGRRLAVGTSSSTLGPGVIALFRAEDGAAVGVLGGAALADAPRLIAFSRDARKLAAVASDTSVAIWEVPRSNDPVPSKVKVVKFGEEPARLEAWYRDRAEAADMQNFTEGMLWAYGRLIEIGGPGKRVALGRRAHALVAVGRWKEAIADAREAIRLGNRGWTVSFDLGLALLREGDAGGASEAASRAIDAKPPGWQSFELRAAALMNLGRFDDALDDLDSSIARTEDFAELWTERARCRVNAGRWRGVFEDAEEAIRRESPGGEASYWLGVANARSGQLEPAAEAFGKASLDPSYAPDALSHMAILEKLRGGPLVESLLDRAEMALAANDPGFSLLQASMLTTPQGQPPSPRTVAASLRAIERALPVEAGDVALICSNLVNPPPSLTPSAILERLKDKLTTAAKANDLTDATRYQITLGVAALFYRDGSLERAITLLEGVTNSQKATPALLAYAAMAHHRLGHADEARRQLDLLNGMLRRFDKDPLDPEVGHLKWPGVLTGKRLLAEARVLIEPGGK